MVINKVDVDNSNSGDCESGDGNCCKYSKVMSCYAIKVGVIFYANSDVVSSRVGNHDNKGNNCIVNLVTSEVMMMVGAAMMTVMRMVAMLQGEGKKSIK